MYCNKCGKQISDTSRFCDKCGAEQKIIAHNATQMEQNSSQDDITVNPNSIKPNAEKNTRLIIILGGVAILLLIIIFSFSILIKAHIIANPFSDNDSEISQALEDIKEDSSKKTIDDLEHGSVYDSGSSEDKGETNENNTYQRDMVDPINSRDKLSDTEAQRSISFDDPEIESNVEESVTGDSSAEYVLPQSDTRYYSRDELQVLSDEELRIARNEIYARHGRRFKSEDLQEFFISKQWYEPRYEEINENELNKYEIANRDLIVSIEKDR